MATLNSDRAQAGWRFWLLWMGACIVGVFVYALMIPFIVAAMNAIAPAQQAGSGAPGQTWTGVAIALIGSGTLGAVIGLAQWLVLRRYLRGSGWWVLATAIGYAVPLALGPLFPLPQPPWLAGGMMFLLFGIVLGVLQWLVLRGRVQKAGWWVAISIVSWLAAFALIGAVIVSGLYAEPFDLYAAFLVPVALAGAGIVWVLRRAAPVVQATV